MRRLIPLLTLAVVLSLTTGCKKDAAPEKKEAAAPATKAPTTDDKATVSPEKTPAPDADVQPAPPEEAAKILGPDATPAAATDTKGLSPEADVAVAKGSDVAPAAKSADVVEAPKSTGRDFVHMDATEVTRRQKQFVPVRIEWDQSLLDDNEKELVRTLIRAARVVDHIFWMQASPDGLEWRKRLAQLRDPESRALFHYLMVNYGAYDRLAANEPFLGETPKPKGANYYPTDMTKEEFETWLKDHPDDAKAFKSNFTVIRRQDDKLVAVPYSQAYKRELQAAHQLLLQSADLATNESLKTYLKSRAQAFMDDDYYQSDMDWMDLDSNIEVTIGPYEVYEDHLFGYKAAFEAFITVKDPQATAKLETFKSWLDKLEKNLPIPDEHKNFKRGKSSPLPVVDVVFTAGDTRAGVQTIAFNLPNDERVREQKGSKKVMLRNVGMAKFHKILTPIARRVLAEDKVGLLHPDAYFNHTLLHEIAHGLGPGTIAVNGEETTVNLALKELYPHLEEAKADILGLYNALYLIDEGVVELAALTDDGTPKAGEKLAKEQAKEAVVATFLAGIFRSTRFGVEEAHGKANLILFNYLVDKGAFTITDDGRMDYDFANLVDAVKECAHEILMIQALGDYAGCKAFIDKFAVVRPEMQAAWDGLTMVPVDIEPIYEIP